MNLILPSLTTLLLALLVTLASGQPPAFDTLSDDDASDLNETTYASEGERRMARGDALMLAAIQTVSEQNSISARLRQQINLLGHQLAGPGIYLQQGRGASRKFRLELSIQRTGATSSLSQVSDGRFLWIYENLKDQPELKIIDLRRVRDELAKAESTAPITATANTLAFGGLPRMLTDLQAGFQFLPVNETSLGNVPVHELRGLWRPEPLARLLPEQAEAIVGGRSVQLNGLPINVPHEVVIFIGKSENFPHRIEFHRINQKGEGPRTTPVVILELFEVRLNNPIDASQFAKPANLPEADHTRRYLENLGARANDK